MTELKDIISSNIISLRKKNKLTQAELAEKLNYSDKAISKWERGESLPDIDTLKSVAELFGVTVDFLLTENPEEFADKFKNPVENKPNQLIITMLAVCLAWLVATIAFVSAQVIWSYNFWMAFVWAVPISCLILHIFNKMWGKRIYCLYIDSALVWTFITALYLQLLSYNLWLIFVIGVPLQVLIVLWARLKPIRKSKR